MVCRLEAKTSEPRSGNANEDDDKVEAARGTSWPRLETDAESTKSSSTDAVLSQTQGFHGGSSLLRRCRYADAAVNARMVRIIDLLIRSADKLFFLLADGTVQMPWQTRSCRVRQTNSASVAGARRNGSGRRQTTS